MEAWRTLPRLRNTESFDAWLCGITANRCRTWRRTWTRRRRRDALGKPAELTERRTDDDLGASIRQAMDRLSARDREIIVLRFIEELSPEAIGRALGLSRGAVDVRVHRARKRLQDLLAPGGIEAISFE